MVVPEIQQVTTRSKGKQSEWEVQEAICKPTKEWVKEANSNNVMRMMQENGVRVDRHKIAQIPLKITLDSEEAWKV